MSLYDFVGSFAVSDGMAHKINREDEMAASIPLDAHNAARRVLDVFVKPGGWFVDSDVLVARAKEKRDSIANSMSGIEAEMGVLERRNDAIGRAIEAIEVMRSLGVECADDEKVVQAVERMSEARKGVSEAMVKIDCLKTEDRKRLARADSELLTSSVANEIVVICKEILATDLGRCTSLARRMRSKLRDFYEAATSGADARPDGVTKERGDVERLNARTFAKVLRGANF